MLPYPGQVGEPQIDHLDLLVLDRLHEIFGCRTIRKHGFAPVVEDRIFRSCRRTGAVIRPETDFGRRFAFFAADGSPRSACARRLAVFSCASRWLQLSCGPRMSFIASSTWRQV